MNSNEMHLSAPGQRFLYGLEAQRGVSNHLYWPGGDSGVTLGAGFDMKERDAASIAGELAALGLSAAVCAAVSKAAGLAGGSAECFAGEHAGLVDLTEAQETALLVRILPPYEARVRNAVRVTMAQQQFDALVSFAYNPGGSFGDVAALINAGQADIAMSRMRSRVFSGRRRLDDLVRRRADETRLYLTGHY